MSRKTLTENVEDMQDLLEEIRSRYGFQKVQLVLHMKRGYHFMVNRKFLEVNDFPKEFIQVQEGNKVHRFMTEDLSQLNNRYQDSLREIWRFSEIELGALLNVIFKTEVLTALHRLCDGIAILDTLTSFVTYSSCSEAPMHRPNLTDGGPIAFQNAFHPVLLEVRPHKTVPNDVFLDETSALHIISGRNQSGKSTFLRMVGLICVMAHTGGMVPAKFASVRILKRIFTRLETADDVTLNQSHYSREMQDVATIINGIRESGDDLQEGGKSSRASFAPRNIPSTLVLIDELGRSTSTLDGFSIAFAVAEYLSKCPWVLTVFATHFLGLGVLATTNPMISTFHLKTVAVPDENQNGADDKADTMMKFTYNVTNGILTETNYGIDTAKAAGFPNRVLQDARELCAHVPVRRITLAADLIDGNLNQTQKRALQNAASVVSIAQRISLIRTSTTDPDKQRRLLLELQMKAKDAKDKSKRKGGSQVHSRPSDAATTGTAPIENKDGPTYAK